VELAEYARVFVAALSLVARIQIGINSVMRCFHITGSDDRMDCRDMYYDPLNPLPPKCEKCGFPDLDHVPQPYYLVKSRTMSPNEIALAENGNFLVRSRIRRIFELFASGQCDFFPTCFKGTALETPWSLVVPANQVITARVDPAIPRCETCGQPRSAHPGSQYVEWLWNFDSESEVLKSSTWGSCTSGWKTWISRHLFMSVRLFHLFKKVKANGLDEATCGKRTKPNTEESDWIKQKLELLKEHGIPFHPAGTLSEEDSKWLRD
jgi:hypothetical protein